MLNCMLMPFNICTLILLQTDSSPSLSLAQLTKVLFLDMASVFLESSSRVNRFILYIVAFFMLYSHVF